MSGSGVVWGLGALGEKMVPTSLVSSTAVTVGAASPLGSRLFGPLARPFVIWVSGAEGEAGEELPAFGVGKSFLGSSDATGGPRDRMPAKAGLIRPASFPLAEGKGGASVAVGEDSAGFQRAAEGRPRAQLALSVGDTCPPTVTGLPGSLVAFLVLHGAGWRSNGETLGSSATGKATSSFVGLGLGLGLGPGDDTADRSCESRDGLTYVEPATWTG